MDAAKAATDHVFQHQLEVMEQKITDFSANFPDALWETLKKEGIEKEKCKFVEMENGQVELRFNVTSQAQAKRISKTSGVKIFHGKDDDKSAWMKGGVPATMDESEALEELMHFHKDSFLKGLYGADKTAGFTIETLNQALEQADEFSVADKDGYGPTLNFDRMVNMTDAGQEAKVDAKLNLEWKRINRELKHLERTDPERASDYERLDQRHEGKPQRRDHGDAR